MCEKTMYEKEAESVSSKTERGAREGSVASPGATEAIQILLAEDLPLNQEVAVRRLQDHLATVSS
jgi:hypothetical protein